MHKLPVASRDGLSSSPSSEALGTCNSFNRGGGGAGVVGQTVVAPSVGHPVP